MAELRWAWGRPPCWELWTDLAAGPLLLGVYFTPWGARRAARQHRNREDTTVGGRLALTEANLTFATPDGVDPVDDCKKCAVQVIGSLLRVTENGAIRTELDNVDATYREGHRKWRVTLTDGTVVSIDRQGCSTCGGR